MPSPFPGVDPYLEDPARWPDFHDRFINTLSEFLLDRLPNNYEANIRERVYLFESDDSIQQIVPDVAVQRGPDVGRTSHPRLESESQWSDPVTVPNVLLDPIGEHFVEIRSQPDQELIAVIEVLSPSNKAGRGRVEYLDKRDEILRTDVHLIELDFLLGGLRVPLAAPLPTANYYALVSRGNRRPDCNVYHWTLRQPLPALPIPLKTPDADVTVDLKAAFDMAYSRGRFERRLRYHSMPLATIPETEREWVAGIAAGASREV